MNLPPLPIKNFLGADGLWEEQYGPYTADQMREYGEACAKQALEESVILKMLEEAAAKGAELGRKQALEEAALVCDEWHEAAGAHLAATIRSRIK